MKQDTSQRKQSKGISAKIIKLSALFSLFFALCSSAMVYADDAPLHKMRDEVISYFKPMTGKVTMVEGKKVVFSLGAKDNVKTGMRFTILREGSPFIHPVTKEPLGKLESSTGKLEVKEVGPDQSTGYIITGDAKEGDKIRISESKVSMLFCQSNDIDWYLADSLYRALKETGRFNMIDTDIETDNPSKVIEEAKKLKAEVALLVTAKAGESGTLLTQRLFWANDSMKFSEMEAKVDVAYAKKLRFGEELFISQTGEAWLQFDMPYGARFITIGDIDGDGKQEILLSTGKDIRVYTPGIDLQPALGGVQITGYGSDDILWVDTIDLNKNGIDEVIITSLGGDDVTSYIYELRGTEFILLFKGNFFLRRLENRLIAQAYSKAEGFDGDVFSIIWDGEYKKGDRIKLPKGVNIYDFVYVDDPHTGRVILAYDEDGFLNIYDEKGIRIWRSKTDMGGFLSTFKKAAPTVMIDRGKWSMKDKLMLRNREVLFVKRVPLFEMAKGLGYKSSQIKNLWWNGLSMEESVLIDDIRGSVIDYAVAGDKIIVLASPMFGIKHENILKGENPLRTMLYIYSMKGR